MEPSLSLKLDTVKFDNAIKTFKQSSKFDKNHWLCKDVNWLLFKFDKKPIKDEDMDWLAFVIEDLDFFQEMLIENDEV